MGIVQLAIGVASAFSRCTRHGSIFNNSFNTLNLSIGRVVLFYFTLVNIFNLLWCVYCILYKKRCQADHPKVANKLSFILLSLSVTSKGEVWYWTSGFKACMHTNKVPDNLRRHSFWCLICCLEHIYLNIDVGGPIHVNLNKTVFYVSQVNIFCLLSPTCMFMAYQYILRVITYSSMCHFTMLFLLLCMQLSFKGPGLTHFACPRP